MRTFFSGWEMCYAIRELAMVCEAPGGSICQLEAKCKVACLVQNCSYFKGIREAEDCQ